MALVKGRLDAVDPAGGSIVFMYNPNAISFSRTVEWKENKGSVGNSDVLPSTDYKGVKPYEVTISNMLIDTYESRKSCQSYIEDLKSTVSPVNANDGGSSGGGMINRKRPAVYMFKLGESISLRCVVTNLTYNYTMFLPNGDPVRAMVTLKLREVAEIASGEGQGNSSTGSQNRTAQTR